MRALFAETATGMTVIDASPQERRRVVILGGGFAGLAAARASRHADVDVVLIDRRNHHIFQPLLYQVTTAVLSAAEIAAPLRQLEVGQQKSRRGAGGGDRRRVAVANRRVVGSRRRQPPHRL